VIIRKKIARKDFVVLLMSPNCLEMVCNELDDDFLYFSYKEFYMNVKVLISGVCTAGVIAAVATSIGKSDAHAAYMREIEKLNSIPPTEHGQRDAVALRAAMLREKIDPERARRCNEELVAGAKAGNANNENEMIMHYRKALEIDPENASVMSTLAGALRMTGNRDESREMYQAVIKTSKLTDEIDIAKGMIRLLDKEKN
jgi:tetratricopeptide (TPR) repeat protein